MENLLSLFNEILCNQKLRTTIFWERPKSTLSIVQPCLEEVKKLINILY